MHFAPRVPPTRRRVCSTTTTRSKASARNPTRHTSSSRDLAKGVPITGVGFESHFIAGQMPRNVDANMQRYAALGLKVYITELDIRVPTPSTTASLTTHAQTYRDYLAACMRFPACDVAVLWGFTDKDSWIPSTFPGSEMR
jgi:endo-1,4-beta-xylanase